MTSRLMLLFALAWSPLLLADDDEPPLARIVENIVKRVPEHTVAPQYPRKARRDRIEGEVQVCFEIDRKGKPRRVAVRTSTHRAFERPSIKAVRASTFRPIKDDADVPQIKSCRTFVFSLQPAKTADK